MPHDNIVNGNVHAWAEGVLASGEVVYYSTNSTNVWIDISEWYREEEQEAIRMREKSAKKREIKEYGIVKFLRSI